MTTKSQAIPSPHHLKELLSLSYQEKVFIEESRQTIANIIAGHDSRLLFIVGPCSIHDPVAAYEYATKLKRLAMQIEKSCFVVMRAYMEKPRTYLGWRGLVYDPDLNNSQDIHKGLSVSRKLLIALAEMRMPVASEFVEPCLSGYLSDLISWGCIGARTIESPSHRQMASQLPMPLGLKNSTEGNIAVAVHAAGIAGAPHVLVGVDTYGQCSILHSTGNPKVHIVLRGSCRKPNYDPASISKALRLLHKAHLPQRIMIDCAHGNSKKMHLNQRTVFLSVINQILEGNSNIFGLMLESHLFAGNQSLSTPLQYGVSLTDPCMDWEMTESLLLWAHEKLSAS